MKPGNEQANNLVTAYRNAAAAGVYINSGLLNKAMKVIFLLRWLYSRRVDNSANGNRYVF